MSNQHKEFMSIIQEYKSYPSMLTISDIKKIVNKVDVIEFKNWIKPFVINEVVYDYCFG